MAVASFHRNGRQIAVRGFDAPARATLSAWYRAATKGIEDAPDWRDVAHVKGEATVDTITFHGHDWDLFIARKRFLR